MESSQKASPDEARRALDSVDSSTRAVAQRVTAPWWYRMGSAFCAWGLFIGAGLTTAAGDEPSSLGAFLTVTLAVLLPLALLVVLKRVTGVSIDRYSTGMGVWLAVFLGLFGVALVIQVVAEVAFVLPVAGAIAFVVTLLTEQRIDERLRQQVSSGAAVG